ncbi:hypothetical protein IE53DRAFT_226806 [Violaceomyces palustris]|uniref:Uncharacterized protein n=1 Tax=Violaceomyces palustris TaxID=1673888 RepID=A0ACD0NPV0_9BASI|nr:hypothetical protein IE53DRAFT_226806 [Violaceomyces palustris]
MTSPSLRSLGSPSLPLFFRRPYSMLSHTLDHKPRTAHDYLYHSHMTGHPSDQDVTQNIPKIHLTHARTCGGRGSEADVDLGWMGLGRLKKCSRVSVCASFGDGVEEVAIVSFERSSSGQEERRPHPFPLSLLFTFRSLTLLSSPPKPNLALLPFRARRVLKVGRGRFVGLEEFPSHDSSPRPTFGPWSHLARPHGIPQRR